MAIWSFKQIQRPGQRAARQSGLWTGGVAPLENSSLTSGKYQMGDKYPIIGSYITTEHIRFE